MLNLNKTSKIIVFLFVGLLLLQNLNFAAAEGGDSPSAAMSGSTKNAVTESSIKVVSTTDKNLHLTVNSAATALALKASDSLNLVQDTTGSNLNQVGGYFTLKVSQPKTAAFLQVLPLKTVFGQVVVIRTTSPVISPRVTPAKPLQPLPLAASAEFVVLLFVIFKGVVAMASLRRRLLAAARNFTGFNFMRLCMIRC